MLMWSFYTIEFVFGQFLVGSYLDPLLPKCWSTIDIYNKEVFFFSFFAFSFLIG